MSQRTVVVVGSVNVDLVVAAPHLPAPGETVLGGDLRTFGGGKGANAAVAAARGGAAVHLVAAVGRDDHGRAALAELRADGIDVTAVAELAGPATGVALIVVDAAGGNQITLAPGANRALSVPLVEEALARLLAGAGCVLVSTEIPGDSALAAIRAAGAAGVPCVLNPAPMVPAVADALTLGPLLTPNATELAQLTALLPTDPAEPATEAAGVAGVAAGVAGQVVADQTAADRVVGDQAVAGQVVALSRRTGAPVVVTRGAEGCLAAWPDGTVETFAAPVVDARDTTGAGDTFNGVLAAGLAAGTDLREAIATAVVAASLSVQAEGARTGMPTAAAIATARARRAVDRAHHRARGPG